MANMLRILGWEALLFLALVFLIVLLRTAASTTRVRGVLYGTTREGTRFSSAGRLQLMIASGLTTIDFVAQMARDPGKFPEMSQLSLWIFTGSQLCYLASKYYSLRQRGSKS